MSHLTLQEVTLEVEITLRKLTLDRQMEVAQNRVGQIGGKLQKLRPNTLDTRYS